MRFPKYGKAKCEACGAVHDDCPVEISGGGWHDSEYLEATAILDTTRCNADGCTVRLCSDCPQFVCDSCGLLHCAAHATNVSGEEYCPVCMQDLIESGEFAAEVIVHAHA